MSLDIVLIFIVLRQPYKVFFTLYFLFPSRTIKILFPMSSTLKTPHGTMCVCGIPQ